MSMGERIKAARKALGMTQKALAEVSGVSEITIRKYEADERQPRIEQLRTLADKLGVDLAYIVGAEPDETLEKAAQIPGATLEETEDSIRIHLTSSPAPKKGLPEDTIQAWREGITTRYDKMNDRGKERLFETADDMYHLRKYKKMSGED